MKNPILGTFTNPVITFNVMGISNGLLEALESSYDRIVSLQLVVVPVSPSNC